MAGKVNKVEINGQTVVDLTEDTVDAEHLAEGYTAHGKDGEQIIGTMPPGAAQPDWNDIKNRPFGEEYYAVTWDGTPTGEPVTLDDLPWYKISDALPDPESVKDASVSIETAEAGTMRFSADPVLAGGLLRFMCSVPPLGDMYSMFIAYDGNGEGFSPGMYCVDSSVASTLLGVTITSATAEWVSVKTIDPKYLPDALQFGKSDFSVSWDGSDTNESFVAGEGVSLYKVSDETPAADEIQNAAAILQTPVGAISTTLTPEYFQDQAATWLTEDQYSGGGQPVCVLYEGNAFDASPGVYIADLAVMTQTLGISIIGVSISWTRVKKIDPAYLPEGIGGGGGIKPSDTITIDEDGTAHVNMDGISAYFAEILEEVRNGSY